MTQATQEGMSNTGMNSFETGVLLALTAIKVAIEGSPHFNKELLEKTAQAFLEAAPSLKDPELYSRPLLVLIANQESAANTINQIPPQPPAA